MGNCCSDDAAAPPHPGAFHGQGNRLGVGGEPRSYQASPGGPEVMPAPVVNPHLSDADRDRARKERVAAAEKRAEAMGGGDKKKKKKKADKGELRNPNAEPLMRWS
ncbi:hypothetical protein TeGR_g8603 [Tetraparma gracilis]|uniref:Uncharacterized protein n=1 Tax=Tetraparma gracilis TaxID=2962635 RepID=A0ABQ6M8L9_9STRA|nr:hypothetical protein TeGR_g8603 [Tetraparma gracilis]